MTKSILKLGLLGLLAIAITGMPVQLHAQESAEARKNAVTPFRGKLKAVDKTTKTLSVGNSTIQITAETKITKAGKAATLEEGVVGEDVAGAYRKSEDGKLNAVSVRFGPRVEAEAEAEAKKDKKE